jgi:CDP-2,3-bis-(O-geranylgeranyl)-sn-glycerol synthase
MDIWILFLKSIYFIVPAYFANMAPVLAQKIKLFENLNKPIDSGIELSDKQPLFGKNKTYRGFAVAIIAGLIGAYLQMWLYNYSFFKSVSLGIDYSNPLNPLFLGILLGVGALVGDLVKSFFKRRIAIKSGKSFVPWDQIDFVLGSYLFVMPIYYSYINWLLILSSLIMSFFFHIIVNHAAFYLGIRKEKW